MNKKRTVDLIHGPILPSLLSFAFPILLSNIFQQLYNTADVLIVGRFLGQESLAAVGATTAIFDLIVGFTLGVGNGMGIVIARYYGARNFTKIKVVKNKVAPPFKEAFVEIMYGEGISKTGELLKIASDLDIIKKAGAWYSYKDEKIGQGSENAKKYLADNPEVFDEIDHQVRVQFGLIDGEEAAESKKEEATQVDSVNEEVTLDLGDELEIEIEE